jgi:hypothetical protein
MLLAVHSLYKYSSKRCSKDGGPKLAKPPHSHSSSRRVSSEHSSGKSKHRSDTNMMPSNSSTKPQYGDTIVQNISEVMSENSNDGFNPPQGGHIPTNPLAFKNYQPYNTDQPLIKLFNSYFENLNCPYHSSVLHVEYKYGGTRDNGLNPIDRWMRESNSEQAIISYSHDGSSTLRQGCICSQVCPTYTGLDIN